MGEYKSMIYALVAIFCYAGANVLIEQKFSKLNPYTLVISFSVIVTAVAFTVRQITKTDDPSFNFPTGNLLWIMVGLGLIYS